MKIGNREFEKEGRTYVMGILNITPDSFSDGGLYADTDRALFRVEKMLEEGMDIVDIGAESTRPGASPVSSKEELSRLLPVLKAVKARFDVPVSVDTYKGEVAKEVLLEGADLINDIWGLQYDEKMAQVLAKYGAPCCLVHNRREAVYENLLEDVAADLAHSLHLARQAGMDEEKILLDPGIGFAKSYEENLRILGALSDFRVLGCPLLLGASRKSVIGKALQLPTEECLEGTLAVTALAVQSGCMFVRVHDVKENVRVIRMMEAILKKQ